MKAGQLAHDVVWRYSSGLENETSKTDNPSLEPRSIDAETGEILDNGV
jgi:hypothetical protein